MDNTVVSAHRGFSISQLNDLISFGDINVSGFTVIIIHAGTVDIAQIIEGTAPQTSVHYLLQCYKALKRSIQMRNPRARLLFSSVLPRALDFYSYKYLNYGLNFALEKWCAKSRGSAIFVPSFRRFLEKGSPISALFSKKDGLHLNGAGVDALAECFVEAITENFASQAISARRVRRLANLP